MLFQHRDVDAGASKKISEHHPGGPTADDAATYFHRSLHTNAVGLQRMTPLDRGAFKQFPSLRGAPAVGAGP
jgi:hypothetical protein